MNEWKRVSSPRFTSLVLVGCSTPPGSRLTPPLFNLIIACLSAGLRVVLLGRPWLGDPEVPTGGRVKSATAATVTLKSVCFWLSGGLAQHHGLHHRRVAADEQVAARSDALRLELGEAV